MPADGRADDGTTDDDLHLGVSAIYGARTGRALVELDVAGRRLLVSPAKAREYASFMVEAATAAEGDEVLMRVLHRSGVSRQRAVQILLAMRQERTVLERRARREMREAIAFDQEEADLDAPPSGTP